VSWFRERAVSLPGAGVVPGRGGRVGSARAVTTNRALQQSVVWASQRLRADLISLMPVDVYRPSKAAGINVPAPTPQVLAEPCEVADGHPMSIGEWLYAGQIALDRTGNNVGVITARDAFGLPARIELVDPDIVTARIRGRRILEWRINGEKHDPSVIWHERQFHAPGLPIGLSPIAYAALALAGGLSALEFAVEWFENGAVPSAILRNGGVTVEPEDAEIIETRWDATVRNGGVLAVGKDWEYVPVAGKAAETAFIEQLDYTDVALTRFFGVPADMVDVKVEHSSTVRYANITQRNLQLLVMNLGGAVKRREDALSRLVPGTRFVKLNRDAVLAMDAKTRAEVFRTQIDSRTRTPDEVRAIEDLPPLDDAAYTQFDRLFGPRVPPRKPEPPDTEDNDGF